MLAGQTITVTQTFVAPYANIDLAKSSTVRNSGTLAPCCLSTAWSLLTDSCLLAKSSENNSSAPFLVVNVLGRYTFESACNKQTFITI